MSTLSIKELSHPSGEVIKIAAGKTLDLKSQGTTTLPTGSVLQVVNASTLTEVSTTGSSYIDTGLTATITPTSATSTILVLVSQVGVGKAAGNGGVYLKLIRGATHLAHLGNNMVYTGTADALRTGGVSANYLDSPATTSATTYKTQFRAFNSVTAYVQQTNAVSTITLMEIQG